MQVMVDVERCIGAGRCVVAAGSVFDQDEVTGIVALLDPTPRADQRDAVERAVNLCPSGAIRVHDQPEGSEPWTRLST